MWWRGQRRPSEALSPVDPAPVVLSVTEALTGATAERLSGQIAQIDQDTPVVIDLTGIPSFDSDGAAKLVGLQDRLGADHLTIVGLRQATARLTGVTQPALRSPAAQSGWTVRRLRNLAVVQPSAIGADPDALDGTLSDAIEQDVAIVVCDLRGTTLTDTSAAALAFASSTAALRGQELLVVNVATADVARLRGLGLSATTYVAPES